MNWKKLLFTVLGAVALGVMVSSYGFLTLAQDFKKLGLFSVVLIFTFVPTLGCYAIGWRLVTEFSPKQNDRLHWARQLYIFFRMSAASIAWNNLTPFLKVGGEPAKVFMLHEYLVNKKAIQSVVIYNIVHILATLASFVMGAFLIPLLFNVTTEMYWSCVAIGFIGTVLFVLLLLLAKLRSVPSLKSKRFRMVRKGLMSIRWSLQNTVRFYKKHTLRFYVALLFEVVARFIEGLTFYAAFYFIQKPISFSTAALLDVGRTLMDTVFFFIPYQVGSREGGVLVLLQDVFSTSSEGYLSAVFMYRFVEITWIMIGYLFWVRAKSSRSSVM